MSTQQTKQTKQVVQATKPATAPATQTAKAETVTTKELKTVQVGQSVQYTIPRGPSKGEQRPALVLRINEEDVDLVVFYDRRTDGAMYEISPAYVYNVKASEDGARGTYTTI